MTSADWLALVVLAVTASGYLPRWTCVPHAYIAFSLSVGLTLPNGGEQVAQILTVFLVPLCLGDRRRWHWQLQYPPIPPVWRGIGYAAQWAIRLQASVIYLNTAISKVMVAPWREGTAMYVIAHHPYYLFPGFVVRLIGPALDWFPVVAAMTWGAIASELAIGVLILGTRATRLWALAIGVVLHTAIGLLMGLPTFALIMICLLAVAANRDTLRAAVVLPSTTDDTDLNAQVEDEPAVVLEGI